MWEQMSDFLTPVIAAAASLVFAFSLVMLCLAALLQAFGCRVVEARMAIHGASVVLKGSQAVWHLRGAGADRSSSARRIVL
jgi:hypothetical protein